MKSKLNLFWDPEVKTTDYFFCILQVDLLPEIALAPRVLSNYVTALSHNAIRGDLDKFLQTRHQPLHFLTELPGKLRLSTHEVRVRSLLLLVVGIAAAGVVLHEFCSKLEILAGSSIALVFCLFLLHALSCVWIFVDSVKSEIIRSSSGGDTILQFCPIYTYPLPFLQFDFAFLSRP